MIEVCVRLNPGTLVMALVLAACAQRAVWADVFVLKDKRRLEGVAERDGDALIITTYEGKVIRVKESDVVLSTKQPARNEYFRRLKRLKKDDAAGHYELARWARLQGMKVEAKKHFIQVLKMDPFHEGSGKALGYVQKNGRWVPSGVDPIVIAPAKPVKRGPMEDKKIARRLADRIKAISELTFLEGNENFAALVKDARERPQVFARVLRRPGGKGGADIQDAVIRAKAAFLLGEGGNRKAMAALIDACVRDPDPDDRVRHASATALARLEEPIVVRSLVDLAINGKNPWPYRQLASIALRRVGDNEAIDRLLAEVSFELAAGNPRDAKNKMRAGPGGLGTDNPMMLPAGPPPTINADDRVLYPALSALKEVSGVSFDVGEKDFKTWKVWWEKAKKTFKLNTK